MSGLTTTGATVLSSLDKLPSSINIWRAQLHWLGGLGVIVLVVAVLPLLGVGGRQMFKAETPGPMKDDKLTPRMAETAKGLWKVYILLTLICIVLYWLFGMTPGDALVHAFSVMGLGGFSSHDASFGFFKSLPLELITEIFALIAGLNFAMHFMALRGRTLSPYRTDPEIRWFFAYVLGSCLMLGLLLWSRGVYHDFPSALRDASFSVISMSTTLGLSTADFGAWPYFAGLWLLFLCSFTTSAGSTGGGIKMLRAVLLYKQVYRELLRVLHPHAQINIRLGEQVVPDKVMYAVLAFFFVYVASIVALSFLLSLYRPGRAHRLFRHRRLHQQHRSRSGPGRPLHHLCRADGFPDLDLHLRHAAGPLGTVHAAGGADPRLLAQINVGSRGQTAGTGLRLSSGTGWAMP
jgi:trk system potassium uptake protein TrkH